jgi:NAD(P)-dependent dehydrogenase (short-subunit alcohol dehydrogenase family)
MRRIPPADFTEIVSVNLIGTFDVTRLGAGCIAKTEPIEGERGVIINTAPSPRDLSV